MDINEVIGSLEDAKSAVEDALRDARELRDFGPDDDDDCDCEQECVGIDAAIEAINQIRRGAMADAIVTLERHFLPKWNDAGEARRAYKQVMEASNGTNKDG